MTYDQSLIRHRKGYRKDNNLDPIPATVYGYDTTLPGYVLVQFVRSNGRLSGPVPVRPPTRYMNLKPGAAVMLEYYRGQLRIAETDNETEMARGNNPLAAILQAQSSKITQMDIATLNVMADGSLSLTIAAWNPIVNGTAYQFPGARLDMTSSKPASGQMCYALLAVKSDYATTEIKTSTARAVTDVALALADVQECITALTAGSTATFAIRLTGDLTGITPEYFKQNAIDCRQLVNTAGGGGGNLTAKYLLQQADATLPNAQSLGALATGLIKNTTTTGVLSIAAAADVANTIGSDTQGKVYATPAASSGVPSLRALVASDLPAGIGGGITVKNTSGGAATANDAGYIDAAGEYKTTTAEALDGVNWCVVVTGGANNADIVVARAGRVTVKLTASCSAGDFLITSTTGGSAKPTTVMKPAIFARAIDVSFVVSTVNYVSALLLCNTTFVGVKNANGVHRNASSSVTGWTGTINGVPTSTSVVVTTVTGALNCLIPQSATELFKARLFNTTRGTFRLIKSVSGTTITTETSVDAWANTDALTISSATIGTGWMELDGSAQTVVPLLARGVALLMFGTDITSQATIQIHPLQAYAGSLLEFIQTQVASIYLTYTAPFVPLIGQVFGFQVAAAGGVGTADGGLAISGYWLATP